MLARLPVAERATAHSLARQGDLRAIEEWAAHIEMQSEQYAPLADGVRKLARDFEEGKLLALFESCMEPQ